MRALFVVRKKTNGLKQVKTNIIIKFKNKPWNKYSSVFIELEGVICFYLSGGKAEYNETPVNQGTPY